MGASGSTTINFGAFPGAYEKSVDVATVGVVAASLIEAWVLPIATVDHTADEHIIERIKVTGVFLSNGNIRIWGRCDDSPAWTGINYQLGQAPPHTMTANTSNQRGGGSTTHKAQAQRLYGQFTVGWVWE